MATTVTFLQTSRLDTTQSTQRVRGTITLSGSSTASGDPLNLGGALSPVQSSQPPLYIDFSELSATPSGATFAYNPGTNPTNGKLWSFTAYNTPVTGAYTSPLTTTTIYFEAIFPLGM